MEYILLTSLQWKCHRQYYYNSWNFVTNDIYKYHAISKRNKEQTIYEVECHAMTYSWLKITRYISVILYKIMLKCLAIYLLLSEFCILSVWNSWISYWLITHGQKLILISYTVRLAYISTQNKLCKINKKKKKERNKQERKKEKNPSCSIIYHIVKDTVRRFSVGDINVIVQYIMTFVSPTD